MLCADREYKICSLYCGNNNVTRTSLSQKSTFDHCAGVVVSRYCDWYYIPLTVTAYIIYFPAHDLLTIYLYRCMCYLLSAMVYYLFVPAVRTHHTRPTVRGPRLTWRRCNTVIISGHPPTHPTFTPIIELVSQDRWSLVTGSIYSEMYRCRFCR